MTAPVDIFRALADPTRLRILSLLRSMELSVGELAQVLGQSQPRVSRHVKILCDAALATRRREGSWVFLVPGDPIRFDSLFSAMDDLSRLNSDEGELESDSARLSAVRADRAAFAERYFANHAKDWDAIRSLHVSEEVVEAKIAAALGEAPIGRLVDVGTGTGRMIELFGAQARHVIGIDRSPEMLRLARAKLADAGLSIDLRQGDINGLPLDAGAADTVILHQVLHYLPAPEVAIAELARVVVEGGQVLIIDFAPHEHEDLRESDAHARLGFSDEQMRTWMAAAELNCDLIDELIGDPLTVKIWRGRKISQQDV